MSRTVPLPRAVPRPHAETAAAAAPRQPRDLPRWSAAAALAVAAAVHIPVIPEHLRQAPYMGVLFIALTTVCFALAAAVLLPGGERPVVWAASAAVCAAAVGAYVLSRTVALPEIGDDVGAWADPLGLAALGSESLTVVLAGVALVRHRA